MKLTNLGVLFVVLELCLLFVLDHRMNHLTALHNKTIEYNKALDSSVDNGTHNLVEVDSKRNIVLNKEEAVERFFYSLYANFGVVDDGIQQRILREHVPILLITDVDGFYIYYKELYESEGNQIIGARWSEKYPYVYEDNNYIYKFTLEDEVTLYHKEREERITGNYKELGLLYTDSVVNNEDTYDTIRRLAIIEEMEKWMNFYINQYNSIAYECGITYQFWLPRVEKTDWYRTIDDISMFVLFQNYPYHVGSQDTYNRYAFGGARISKSSKYFIKEIDDMRYYHKANCTYAWEAGLENAYYTKEDCALEGAFPCPDCNP
ncbi:MAG: hypothetical protein ACK5JH_06905 [Anaerocolumna sp.]